MHARKGQKYLYAKYETDSEAKTRPCELHEGDYSQPADSVVFLMAKTDCFFCPRQGEKRTTGIFSYCADLLYNIIFSTKKHTFQ